MFTDSLIGYKQSEEGWLINTTGAQVKSFNAKSIIQRDEAGNF